MWCLIESIPDLFPFSHFYNRLVEARATCCVLVVIFFRFFFYKVRGARWLSGRVDLRDLRSNFRGFENSKGSLCCILEQDTLSSVLYWYNSRRQEIVSTSQKIVDWNVKNQHKHKIGLTLCCHTRLGACNLMSCCLHHPRISAKI